MPSGENLIFMAVGIGFIVLGVVGILWGRHEEKVLFEALSKKIDLREFVSHEPERPQPGALRIGGWIAVSLGLILLVVGIVRWLLAGPTA